MKRLRFFEEPGIGALVLLAGKEVKDLEVGEHGVLAIPSTIKPTGFYLVLAIPEDMRIVVAQKNIAQKKGAYHHHALTELESELEGCTTWVMTDPIIVMRSGGDVWTSWHHVRPNRLDCWIFGGEGHIDLFQVGVITHDNGQTFRLLGEYRWQGQLFRDERQEIVGKPDNPKWGPFDVRRQILENPDSQRALNNTQLLPWQGSREELEVPLQPSPGKSYARVDWWTPFAGRTGQGIVRLHDNSSAWIHGADILDLPDPDGIKRLWRDELISYEGKPVPWGTKKGAPPKLLKVRRVRA